MLSGVFCAFMPSSSYKFLLIYPYTIVQWSVKCGLTSCKPCPQCSDTPRCAASCHTRVEPWWPDEYPQHTNLYPNGYKCTSIPECLGCPACTGKPNILFIFSDDVALHHIVSPHLPPLKNINKLKRAGMSFTDAHSTPLCAPSRYVVLSGRLPFRGRRRSGPT